MNSSFSSSPELQRALNELHPFHFVLGEDLRVARSGRLLRRILGEQIDGRPFEDLFEVIEPKYFSPAASWDCYKDVLLKGRESELTLRGQCMTLEGSRYFLGSPWFSLDMPGNSKLSAAMARSERWGEQLMAIQLFEQQRRDIATFREKLSQRNRERDAVQSALMEEKARLQTVLSAAMDAIVTIDSAGEIVSVNPAATKLFGYSTEEMIGKNVKLLMPESIAREHDDSMRRYLKTGERHVVGIGRGVMARRKNGTDFPCELSLGEMSLGGSTYFTGILRDITERKVWETKQAEILAALQRSYSDLERILNQLRLGILALDASGRVTFASEHVPVERKHVIGARWDEVLKINEEMRNEVHVAIEKPESDRRRLVLAFGGGAHRHWVELEIRDDPRGVGSHIFYLYDVTDLYRLKQDLTSQRPGQIVGDSVAIDELHATISRVARGDWTVLIEGETGTGKELVAQAIQFASARRGGPFIVANCSGLTESILGSELFGHIKGAFTGAVYDRKGLFEAASGGTLFLDEIGDVTAPVQSALLRALQEKEITRLGETRARKVDVRIVTATHRNLQQLVKAGMFREDLLYRLRSARIRTPPLRDHREDIPQLVSAFLAEERVTAGKVVTGVSPEAMRRLARYPWPGNVREIRGAIEHAVVHCQGSRIEVDCLPPELLQAMPLADPVSAHRGNSERERIVTMLRRTGGNRARAARMMGIGRATLYRRLRNLGITASEADEQESA
jgi:PAS domain S-box-containing protein